MTKKIGVWFTDNLRISDNTVLKKAIETRGEILPFYVFDEKKVKKELFGMRKIGKYRARFLIESLGNLRKNLQLQGSNIDIVRIEKRSDILTYIEKEKLTDVYVQEPVGIDEKNMLLFLQKELVSKGVRLVMIWDHTLVHPSDLPFSLRDFPKVFTDFRKQVERNWIVEKPITDIVISKSVQKDSFGEIPTLSDFGYSDFEVDSRRAINHIGGEDEANSRLKHYLWESNSLAKYKETRNGLIGADYSSKFSAWLSLGCITSRQIYAEIQKYEKHRVKNDSTYWLIFELLWRDFFQFVCLQNPMIFFSDFPEERYIYKNQNERELFQKWTSGNLGVPFVDANMKELTLTGFMSNRGRQNVASYLKNDLKLDWRLGAAYFEEQLVDYDVASNWGNWAYVAGVGNDPRDNRYFNIERQQSMYDTDGAYRKLWKTL